MKFELEGQLLRMFPEGESEQQQLNQLWTIIIGCVNEGKKLVPVGQYVPGQSESANFSIE